MSTDCTLCVQPITTIEDAYLEWTLFEHPDLFMGQVDLIHGCGHCSRFNEEMYELELDTEEDRIGGVIHVEHWRLGVYELSHWNEAGFKQELAEHFVYMDAVESTSAEDDRCYQGWNKVKRALRELGVPFDKMEKNPAPTLQSGMQIIAPK